MGPVSISAGLLLLVASPWMRGGNRHVALIGLELISLLVLLAIVLSFCVAWARGRERPAFHPLLALLVLSPLLLALVQLTPLPADLWAALPGHAIFKATLQDAGVAATGPRALSVAPWATQGALLAALPIVAALLLGYLASLRQLRLLLGVVVAVAFAQVLLGMLQVFGGEHSPLFFGMLSFGPPIGSFANRNHFANYLAMALAAYVWLGYEANRHADRPAQGRSFGHRHRVAIWAIGGLVLVLGVLISRSRGAALFGLAMALLGLAVVALRMKGWSGGWRLAVPAALALLVGAAALTGFDSVGSRMTAEQLGSSASFRGALARTSFQAALAYWPWGSGWGTYDMAYARFQPASIAGFANHAHMDYVEMLLEGGIFFLLPALAFVWLAARRALLLLRSARHGTGLDRDAMAATLCGLGLLGLMLHSLVEFNMRIPANAIVAALLAGAFFRPMRLPEPSS